LAAKTALLIFKHFGDYMTTESKWYIETITYPELLKRNADKFPERTAQWWRDETGDHKINFKDLWHNTKAVSSYLIDTGLKKGDRAAIMGKTSPNWAIADYGIMCAGGISVSVYPGLSQQDLFYILEDSGSKVIFIDAYGNFEKIRNIKHKLTYLEKVIFLNEKKVAFNSESTDIENVISTGKKMDLENPDVFDQRVNTVELKDPMMIVYTSGTTGKPKGVVHTYFSFNAACRRDLEMIPVLKNNDVFLSFLPLAHTYEKECGHGIAMYGGCTIAYSSPQTLTDDLQFFSPTIFMSVPRIYERIYMQMKEKSSGSSIRNFILKNAINSAVEAIRQVSDKSGFIDMSEDAELVNNLRGFFKLKYKFFDKLVYSKIRKILGGRLRFAFSASGSLSKELCEAFLSMGVRIYEGYGSTETLNTVNLNRPEKILPGSVGPLCVGVEGKVSQEGEWLVKGDNIFKEYWNKPELTKEAFTDDGFYKTGDIVDVLQDGYIKIKDRKKGLIVLDTGKNVPSAKVESLFALRRYIDTAVAFGNDKKFVSAVIIPDFDAVIRKMEADNINFDEEKFVFEDGICIEFSKDYIEDEYLKKLIESDVDKVNKKLEDYEKIKKYVISNKKLTEATGELTPTLKVKKEIVFNNYKEEVEALYL